VAGPWAAYALVTDIWSVGGVDREEIAIILDCQQIDRAQDRTPGRRVLLEQLVARVVTAGVVELLQAIDVQHRDAQRPALALGPSHLTT